MSGIGLPVTTDAQGCANAAERMVTYKDVLIRRSAWMRERSDAREPPGRKAWRQARAWIRIDADVVVAAAR